MFQQNAAPPNLFLNEVNALREAARRVMREAPDAPGTPVALLQTVLAAEIVCVLRYTMISVSPEGLRNDWIGAEFQEQANDERRHMVLAAGRIEQLGGTPDFSAGSAAARLAASDQRADFALLVRENLLAERGVIEHYHELIGFLAPRDAQTGALLGEILRDEQDHTSDMEDLLASYAG
jgi:bacterioferritin